MILWISFAVVSAAVIAALARPMLVEQPVDTSSAQDADLAVYRDQLAEIEADRQRGLIDSAEAESARAELGRRLIERSGRDIDTPIPASSLPSWLGPANIAYATAAAIPVLAIAIYLAVGSPTMPGMPQSARLNEAPAKAGIDELIAKVEERLRRSPEDGQGWDVVAPVYMRLGRFDDAANAFAQASRLLGDSPKRLKGFAEALVLANNGIVVEPARLAYRQVLNSEPADFEARFWLAMADEQEGKLESAEKAYRAVLAEAPEDAPWKPVVESRLTEIASQRGDPTAKPDKVDTASDQAAAEASLPQTATDSSAASANSAGSAPGPTAEDVVAARDMPPEAQQAFINSMVERLAGRLADNPDDFEGWLRLVRAYSVLGRKDDASRALTSARKSAAGDSQKNARIDALASKLGLGT